MPGQTGMARAIVSKSRKPRTSPPCPPLPSGEGGRERLQLARQRGLDDEALLRHRFQLAPLREVQLLARRQVADGCDTARQVGDGLFRPYAGQVPDVVGPVR